MALLRLLLGVIGTSMATVLALPVLLAGFPFWVVGPLTRALTPFCGRRAVPWHDIVAFDPALGWKPKRNLDADCFDPRDDTTFHVVTGDDGWPGTRSLAEATLVVIGDSYAFGYGVDSPRAFFNVRPDLPIKAYGAPGYNMIQELLLMEELTPGLSGKTVVWFIYLGNDLYDNLSPEMTGYRTPFLRRTTGGDDWEIVTSHLSPSRWSCSVGRRGPLGRHLAEAVHRPTRLADRAYSAVEWLIARGSHTCRRADAQLVIMTIPSPMLLEAAEHTNAGVRDGIDPDLADRSIETMCERLNVPCVLLRNHLGRRDYKVADDHWNEKGHRRMANVLRALNEARDRCRPFTEVGWNGNGPRRVNAGRRS